MSDCVICKVKPQAFHYANVKRFKNWRAVVNATSLRLYTMVTVVELLSLLLVSVLWGCTNPFLKRGAEGIENVAKANRVSQLLAEIKFIFLNLKYLVPFLLNQSGSLVYYYTLSTTELSLAVPVANSLTFLCTLLTGKLLGEEFGGKRAVAGMFLTMTGITLCVISSADDTINGKQPEH